MTATSDAGTLCVSGFADEIDASFDRQLAVVGELRMHQICLRAADGRGVADYTAAEAAELLAPRLSAAGIGVSALGSPIGKVSITDHDAVADQFRRLDELCRIATLLEAPSIRVFSFYVPSPEQADSHAVQVIDRMLEMEIIARRHGVVLVLENEKDTFGDIGRRCQQVLDAADSPYLAAAFDFANFVQCDDDPAACWQLIGSRVADIHIKDARVADGRNVLCGTGDGRIAHILRDAYEHGYRGVLTLEPHLAVFDTLDKLERNSNHTVSGARRYESGAAAYAAQLDALLSIIGQIPGCSHDVNHTPHNHRSTT